LKSDIEHDAIRIANITTWDGRILLNEGAARSDQLGLCRLHIGDEEIKYRTVILALFQVKIEGAGFESFKRVAGSSTMKPRTVE
jgi:hypothetical protein